ncbi:MAG: hypothetical protein LBJ43_00380 [Propionibacteriaceae bacterium]|jgi:KDO2-lipid IV(A) lauroyltransferase|nr:hypothetical protein [Propionibacteriaceae bacterium]
MTKASAPSEVSPRNAKMRTDSAIANTGKVGDEAKQKRGYGLSPKLFVRVLRIAARIPNWLWHPLVRFASWIAYKRQYRAVRQWALNAEVMLGRPPTAAEVQAGVLSWFKNMIGSVQLGKYTAEQNLKRVTVEMSGYEAFHTAWQNGGVVVTLPHMGDWDLAGAWVCAKGIPVSAVVERLPDEEFAFYSVIRRSVGMTIYPHQDPRAFERLCTDLKNGSVVALVADRDLSRRGVPVIWHTASGVKEVTMPPGPVLLARRTGAAIFVAISTFVDYQMQLKFIGPIETEHGSNGLRATCQQIADIFCENVSQNPIDWHLMQRFFPGVVAEPRAAK